MRCGKLIELSHWSARNQRQRSVLHYGYFFQKGAHSDRDMDLIGVGLDFGQRTIEVEEKSQVSVAKGW
ncbi:hypothetical protein VNF293_01110 [Atlantibacter hermannii]